MNLMEKLLAIFGFLSLLDISHKVWLDSRKERQEAAAAAKISENYFL